MKFNEGHIVEGLQTCHIIMQMLDEHLVDHPAVLKVGKRENISNAIGLIMEAYQEIGGLIE